MVLPKPLVAVTADVKDIEIYTWHMTPQTYLDGALHGADVIPVIVPSLGDAIDLDSLLAQVSGVLVTGARANVHPSLYGEQPSAAHEPYDRRRDSTTIPLIRKAVAAGVPLLGICRGIQEMNVAFGGSLATEIQEQDGMMDHRMPSDADTNEERFKLQHEVTIKAGSCLADVLGPVTAKVNSLHRQAISTLAPNLAVEATAEDGTIEAVSVIGAKAFAVGVQWHPEFWVKSDTTSARIFEAFGKAVRARQAEQARSR